jgi:hypothetical protein
MIGMEIWKAAMNFEAAGVGRGLQVRHYFCALTIMLNEAEMIAVRDDCAADAVLKLRELQAHCEKLVNMMCPDQQGLLRLVDAA